MPTAVPSAVATVGGVVTVTDAASGRSVSLRVGQRLRVVLRSTYWEFAAPSAPAVLAADGPATLMADKGCVPGGGCGTVTQDFVARAAGRAVVAASRSSCGEALACTPAQSRFTLTVTVSA